MGGDGTAGIPVSPKAAEVRLFFFFLIKKHVHGGHRGWRSGKEALGQKMETSRRSAKRAESGEMGIKLYV